MKGQSLLQNLVERPDAFFHTVFEALEIKGRSGCKGILHKLRQVDASQQAAASGGQRLLRAGVHPRIGKFLCVGQQVPAGNPIPEQSPRLPVIPVGLRDVVEHFSGVHLFFNFFSGGFPGVMQQERFLLFHRFHEFFTDADRKIGLGHFGQVCFQIDEFLHIRMFAVDGNHQSPPAAVLADEICHQGIQFHKRHGPCSFLGRVVDAGASGT